MRRVKLNAADKRGKVVEVETAKEVADLVAAGGVELEGGSRWAKEAAGKPAAKRRSKAAAPKKPVRRKLSAKKPAAKKPAAKKTPDAAATKKPERPAGEGEQA